LVGDLGSGLETVLTNVKRNYHQIVNSQLTFGSRKVDLNASLLADLVEQLEKRIAFRRAIREALQSSETECEWY
jgi:ribosomal protein S3